MAPRLAAVAGLLCALSFAASAVAQQPAPPDDLVAQVGERPITKGDFDHWLPIARKSDPGGRPAALRRQVMEFLIQAAWIREEATRRSIDVRPERVRQVFERQRRLAFPRPGGYRRFLERTGSTEADVLYRVELSVLQGRVAEEVTDSAPLPRPADVDRYLARRTPRFDGMPHRRARRVARRELLAGRRASRLLTFIERFRERSKAATVCAEGYVVAECGGTLAVQARK